MSRNSDRRVSVIKWGLAIALLLVFAWKISEAGPTAKADAKAVAVAKSDAYAAGGDASVVNDIAGDSSRAYGFSFGPDVDIAQCYRSYSWLIFTDTKLNKWCAAIWHASAGDWEAASRMMCRIWNERRAWGGKKKCRDHYDEFFKNWQPPGTKVADTSDETDPDEDKETHDRYEAEFLAQQQELAYVKEELASVKEIASKPAVVRTIIDPDLEQQLKDDAERRAKARTALKEARNGQ